MNEIKPGDKLEDLATDPVGNIVYVVWTVREVLTGPNGRQWVVLEALVPTERVIERDMIGPRYHRYRPLNDQE